MPVGGTAVVNLCLDDVVDRLRWCLRTPHLLYRGINYEIPVVLAALDGHVIG